MSGDERPASGLETSSSGGETAASGLEDYSLDRFLGGRLSLLQPLQGYRAAVDAPLLAAAVAVRPGDKLAELGCGVGAASFCLLTRLREAGIEGVSVTGLELQPALADLAGRNAQDNDFQAAFRVIRGDLAKPPPLLAPHAFDGVFFNPPYQRADQGRASPHVSRALADCEGAQGLADWLQAALRLLKPKGQLTLIQRADRLGELLAALEGRVGGIVLLPLFPGGGRPAKRILLAATKDSRAPLTLLPGLTLHDNNGRYTPAAARLLRDGAALCLGPVEN